MRIQQEEKYTSTQARKYIAHKYTSTQVHNTQHRAIQDIKARAHEEKKYTSSPVHNT